MAVFFFLFRYAKVKPSSMTNKNKDKTRPALLRELTEDCQTIQLSLWEQEEAMQMVVPSHQRQTPYVLVAPPVGNPMKSLKKQHLPPVPPPPP